MNAPTRIVLAVLIALATACGGRTVPSWEITVELALECESGTSCEPLEAADPSKPIFQHYLEGGVDACFDQNGDGTVTYQVTHRDGVAQGLFDEFGGGVMHAGEAFAIAPYELQLDFETLYLLDLSGTLLPAAVPADVDVKIDGRTVVARYPSGLPGRVIVETHHVTEVPYGDDCSGPYQPHPGITLSGWGPY